MIGTVLEYHVKGAYGFLKDVNHPKIFVHYKAIQDNAHLYPGDKVRFQLARGPRGFEAVKVFKLKK